MGEWRWGEIVSARLAEGGLVLEVGPLAVVLAVALLVAGRIGWGRLWSGRYRAARMEFSYLGVTWLIERNDRTAELAHEAYIELVTRKAAIPFDPQTDVVAEVYDSWYELFGEMRRLARGCADPDETDTDLVRLQDLLISVLNDGLRPHLTLWQARFRRWYERELESDLERSPQEIQRDFPGWTELVESLQSANHTLIDLAQALRPLTGRKPTGSASSPTPSGAGS